jgi:hypothetical protein
MHGSFAALVLVLATQIAQTGQPSQPPPQDFSQVRDAQPVRVTELLSLDAFPPPLLVQPIASSASPLLDVSVELTRNDLPIYRVTFRNRSQRAVMAVAYHTYRGEITATSGLRRTASR